MKVLSFVVLALATAAASAAVDVDSFVELEARVAALKDPSPAEELLADVRKVTAGIQSRLDDMKAQVASHVEMGRDRVKKSVGELAEAEKTRDTKRTCIEEQKQIEVHNSEVMMNTTKQFIEKEDIEGMVAAEFAASQKIKKIEGERQQAVDHLKHEQTRLDRGVKIIKHVLKVVFHEYKEKKEDEKEESEEKLESLQQAASASSGSSGSSGSTGTAAPAPTVETVLLQMGLSEPELNKLTSDSGNDYEAIEKAVKQVAKEGPSSASQMLPEMVKDAQGEAKIEKAETTEGKKVVIEDVPKEADLMEQAHSLAENHNEAELMSSGGTGVAAGLAPTAGEKKEEKETAAGAAQVGGTIFDLLTKMLAKFRLDKQILADGMKAAHNYHSEELALAEAAQKRAKSELDDARKHNKDVETRVKNLKEVIATADANERKCANERTAAVNKIKHAKAIIEKKKAAAKADVSLYTREVEVLEQELAIGKKVIHLIEEKIKGIKKILEEQAKEPADVEPDDVGATGVLGLTGESGASGGASASTGPGSVAGCPFDPSSPASPCHETHPCREEGSTPACLEAARAYCKKVHNHDPGCMSKEAREQGIHKAVTGPTGASAGAGVVGDAAATAAAASAGQGPNAIAGVATAPSGPALGGASANEAERVAGGCKTGPEYWCASAEHMKECGVDATDCNAFKEIDTPALRGNSNAMLTQNF
jgi:hypothetical protein